MSKFNWSTKAALLCLASVWAVGNAFANDSSYGDMNGGIKLTEQPEISMDSESLFISEQRVEVEYVFTNNSDKDLDIPMAFPMPPMYFGEMDHSSIEDFRLWIDDAPATTTRKLVVLVDGETDISAELAALGWDESDLATLLVTGDTPEGKEPLPADWFDENGRPLFTLNEYFVWPQTFVAGKPLKIRHTYTPSVSSSTLPPVDEFVADFERDTCMDEPTKAGIRTRSPQGVSWTHLSYVLVTANNWQGPIKDFKLKLRKQHPSDIISLCFDGDLKKTDALTFEFRDTDFRPTSDLNVLFVRDARPR